MDEQPKKYLKANFQLHTGHAEHAMLHEEMQRCVEEFSYNRARAQSEAMMQAWQQHGVKLSKENNLEEKMRRREEEYKKQYAQDFEKIAWFGASGIGIGEGSYSSTQAWRVSRDRRLLLLS